MKRIVALFSRSGSTLVKVEKGLKIKFETISNNFNETTWSSDLVKDQVVKLKHTEIVAYLEKIEPSIILLFGYLRILPESICRKHKCYNLHPGDIVKHPWLKGKDPIEKYFSVTRKWNRVNNAMTLGSVIHKVIAEVDAGDVLLRKTYKANSIDEAYVKSEGLNVWMWLHFLIPIIYSSVNRPVSKQYFISEGGSLFSLPHVKESYRWNIPPFQILKQNLVNGYLGATIGQPQTSVLIHRLVAEAYLPNPQNKPEVRHLDGGRENNHVGNLEWSSHKETATFAIKTGLRKLNNQGNLILK